MSKNSITHLDLFSMKQKTYVLHLHHEVLFEELTELLENRTKYIKENKPKDEIEIRLRVMRVLTQEEIDMIPWEAREAWEKAQNSKAMKKWHKKVCIPDCPWNGKTLFP